jgi:hypothetical protein
MPAANIEWRGNPAGIAAIDKETQKFLLSRARRVQRNARRMAPGRMGRRVNAVIVGRHVRIESSHPATMYVINGTRPHLIRPRTRKVLKFNVKGRTVFARLVHHPGTKKNDFLTKALRMG